VKIATVLVVLLTATLVSTGIYAVLVHDLHPLPTRDLASYFELKESLPLIEFYTKADRLLFVNYRDSHVILNDSLSFKGNGHVSTLEDWNGSSIDLTCIGDIGLAPVKQGFFVVSVLRVPRNDPDMLSSLTPPRLFGDNLCQSIIKDTDLPWKPFCSSLISSSNVMLSRRRLISEIRVPLLVVTKSALVNKFGFLRKEKYRIVPNFETRRPFDDSFESPHVVAGPVFVVAQLRGEAIYHHMVEVMARLAPYYDQLVADPRIKIHLTARRVSFPFMEFLGFPESRLVSGNVMTQSTVIYPEPSISKNKRYYIIKKLRHILIRRLITYYPAKALQRNKHIVIIRRSKIRSITNFEELLHQVSINFPKEKIVIYRDDPSPPVQESFRMFYEAKMVIAPHGAGLANTIVCKPGTPVIELMMEGEDLNMVFVRLSATLGLRHNGIAPPGSRYLGNFTVDPKSVIKIARIYL